MPDFFFRYDEPGRAMGRDRIHVVCDTVDQARNEAVRHLGAYLMEHPEFASQGHWRVDVEDGAGTLLLHVIVATVTKGASVTST